MPLLDIRNLTIEFKAGEEWVKAVDRVSMTLSEGEIRGLVGESGSGKSLIAKAICGVAKDNWRVTADRMRFDDIDLLTMLQLVARVVADSLGNFLPVSPTSETPDQPQG